jgi:CubicO group peptidase (beta-lactamase class C family)
MLIEEGKLRLSDPVDAWLPELADRRVLQRLDGPLDETVPAQRSITVDDLLTFRLGFGHITEPTFDPPFPIVIVPNEMKLVLGAPDPRTPHPPDEWMRLFGTLPLMEQPGERWRYNAGSLILSVLIARVAGRDLGDVLSARIFEPLGMHHTGFCLPIEETRELPSYYMTNFETGQLELQTRSTPDEWSRPPVFPSGAGGLLSTVDDYLRFARMLLAGGQGLLTRESIEMMTTNRLTPEQVASAGLLLGGHGWGFGVGVALDPEPEWPVPGRYGWSGGYGTTWFNDPHRQIVAMAMTQVSDFLWSGALNEFDKLVGGV